MELPDLSGWTRSALRPLPETDFGFSVAYDHPGVAVTLYQYARSYEEIPDGIGEAVRSEIEGAEEAIQQAVQFGAWDGADKVESGERKLGESEAVALWSHHALTVQGREVSSHTFIWGHNKRIFKVRSTGDKLESPQENAALMEILTAFGKACTNDF